MSHPNPSRGSPTSGAENNSINANKLFSEIPASTNHSTPAGRPAPVVPLVGEDAVITLRLDDIQSAIPFHDAPEGNESKYMLPSLGITRFSVFDHIPHQFPRRLRFHNMVASVKVST